jgi:acyl-CoA synthetase (NDP forming)
MNRIMQPKAVAVIGAPTSRQDRQLGDEEPDQRRLQGQIYPIHPKAAEIMGTRPTRASRTCRRDRHRGVRDPAKLVAGALTECGEKKIAGAILIPSGFGETGNIEGQEELAAHRREVQHPPDGAEHLRLLLHAGEPLRDVLHRVRRQGLDGLSSQSGGIGMAIIGFSRSAKMGVSAIVGLGNKSDIDEDDLLLFFEQDEQHERDCAARET